MNHEGHQKVTARHLARSAYLYVRQSTMRQVLENTESTERQYALRQRAVGRQDLTQWFALLQNPGIHRRDQLFSVDEIHLQCQDAKQHVTVGGSLHVS